MNNTGIKVLIADDHDLIRQGVKRILSFEKEINIIGEADNGKEALKLMESNQPNVLLLDMRMPYMDGLEVLKMVKSQYSDVKTIILTIENDKEKIKDAINIGADGYVLKDSAGTEIVDAIKTVYQGDKFIDKSLVALLFSNMSHKKKTSISVFEPLSKREAEVLLYLSKGYSNKEIADRLFLSEKTVKNYATHLFRKLKVKDRVHAILIAIENNIEEFYEVKFS